MGARAEASVPEAPSLALPPEDQRNDKIVDASKKRMGRVAKGGVSVPFCGGGMCCRNFAKFVGLC